MEGGLEGGSHSASGCAKGPCGRPLAVVVTLDRTLCIGSIPRVESCCVAGCSVDSITAEWHCECRRWIWGRGTSAYGGIVTACWTSSACPSSLDLRALVWLRNPLAISKSIADTGDSRRILDSWVVGEPMDRAANSRGSGRRLFLERSTRREFHGDNRDETGYVCSARPTSREAATSLLEESQTRSDLSHSCHTGR